MNLGILILTSWEFFSPSNFPTPKNHSFFHIHHFLRLHVEFSMVRFFLVAHIFPRSDVDTTCKPPKLPGPVPNTSVDLQRPLGLLVCAGVGCDDSSSYVFQFFFYVFGKVRSVVNRETSDFFKVFFEANWRITPPKTKMDPKNDAFK